MSIFEVHQEKVKEFFKGEGSYYSVKNPDNPPTHIKTIEEYEAINSLDSFIEEGDDMDFLIYQESAPHKPNTPDKTQEEEEKEIRESIHYDLDLLYQRIVVSELDQVKIIEETPRYDTLDEYINGFNFSGCRDKVIKYLQEGDRVGFHYIYLKNNPKYRVPEGVYSALATFFRMSKLEE